MTPSGVQSSGLDLEQVLHIIHPPAARSQSISGNDVHSLCNTQQQQTAALILCIRGSLYESYPVNLLVSDSVYLNMS